MNYLYERFEPSLHSIRTAKQVAKHAITAVLSSTPYSKHESEYPADSERSWIPERGEGEDCSRADTPVLGPALHGIDLLHDYNTTMGLVAETHGTTHCPLTSQLNVPWKNATEDQKSQCVDQAKDDCRLVCSMIAPQSGLELYESLVSPTADEPSPEPIALMTAYKNATTRSLKLQILSIYANRYPSHVLMKFHEPYEKVTSYQIKQARSHATEHGAGNVLDKEHLYRVRLDIDKVDHFLDFANRPYFYQDVAFGTRTLKLDSGEKISMPNVVRTVTRSTMVKQYQIFCEEENFDPLSRSTLFKILEVRGASQRK